MWAEKTRMTKWHQPCQKLGEVGVGSIPARGHSTGKGPGVGTNMMN